MKKIFAIVVIGLVLVSCKKSSPGGSSIQATINDTAANFTTLFTGTISNNGKEIGLSAFNGTNAATAYSMYIYLYSNLAITTPGVFSDTSISVPALPNVQRFTSVQYTPQLPTAIEGVYYSFSPAALKSNPVIVTVTAVSTTSIQGTFSGTIYESGHYTTNPDSIKVITNGRFSANLVLIN